MTISILANQKCEECKYPLLTRAFYIFPCGHGFHGSCLVVDQKVPSARDECQLCNNWMVDSLDKPFVDPYKLEANETWKVPINEKEISL